MATTPSTDCSPKSLGSKSTDMPSPDARANHLVPEKEIKNTSPSKNTVLQEEKSFEESLSKRDIYRIRTYFLTRNDVGVNLTNFIIILKYAVQDAVCTDENALQLFARCDTNNEGTISWIDVVNYLGELYVSQRGNSSSVGLASFELPPSIMSRPQENIRIHLDLIGIHEIMDDHIYLVSAHGTVIEWKLQAETQKTVLSIPDPRTFSGRKLRVSDFTFITNLGKLILASDAGELLFYETIPVYNFICKIHKLNSVPLRLDCNLDQEGSYLVCYGDEEGCINCLHFPDFLEFLPSVRGVHCIEKQTFCFATLVADGVIEYHKWKVHTTPVTQVRYIENINAIVSCAKDKNRSLVIGSIHGKKRVGKFHIKLSKHSTEFTNCKPRVIVEKATSSVATVTNTAYIRTKEDEIVFSIVRGVMTFDFSNKSKYFATGGVDQLLRIWSIDNQSRAIQTQELMGHRGPFVFVKFHEKSLLSLLISMSLDKEIRIWNALYVLIHCLVPYEYIIDDKIPLKSAIFSSKTEKVIKLWNVITGRYLGECYCANEKSPVTYMMTDYQNLKLISAHEDGYIRIWNLGSFQCIKLYTKNNEATITCMTYLHYNQMKWFVSAGWDRQLHFYSNFQNDGRRFQNPIFDIKDKAYYPYEGSFVMTGHILCMTQGPQNRIVIGCDDGEIHVWNVFERKMIKCLIIPPPIDYVPDTICHASLDLRIHKITFLWTRLKRPDFRGGVFVTLGPYNRVHFWTYIIGDSKVCACFQPTIAGLKKTFSCCMELTSDDSLLCTADGRGNIFIWDITKYAINDETTRPPLKCMWKAHKLPVTDLKIIQHEDFYYIITASIDCSVKFYALDGTYVGTFGHDRWDLNTFDGITIKYVVSKKSLSDDEVISLSNESITSPETKNESVCSVNKKSETFTTIKEESHEDSLTTTESSTKNPCESSHSSLHIDITNYDDGITAEVPPELSLARQRRALKYVKDHIYLGPYHAIELHGDLTKPLELPVRPLINERTATREFRRPFQNLSGNCLNTTT